MEPILAIVGKLMELTVEPIIRQLGYLVYYHSNIKELKEKVESLEADEKSLKHAVGDAQRNGEEIEDNVQQWLGRVTQIIEKAERFYQEESHANTGCSLKSCPNLHSRHHLSRKAKKMTQEVVEIKSEGKFQRVSYRKPPQWIAISSTSFSRSGKAFESRMSTLNSIMEALANPSINMVGLYGIGGVGKTTLAKEVAMKALDEKLFELVVMVTVTKDINQENIQKQIGDMVGLKLDEASEFIRAARLHERLKQEKSILIILDDLWERLDLAKIGIPSTNEHKGCKILLTSRSEEVLSNKMNSKRNIMVAELSETEAWELFVEMAELHVHSDPDLLSIATEVAQECAGLPIAIVTVARALKNKSLFEWRDGLRQLQKPTRRKDTGVTKEVDFCIKFSYEQLETKELKSVFLLSAMLTAMVSDRAYIYDLLKYCMGLGLFQGKYTVEEAQDRLCTMIWKLKASCLLLDTGAVDHFRIHDVVRDVALSIAHNERGAVVLRYDKLYEWPENNDLENCTSMCLCECEINELPEVLRCPRLEVFLFSNRKKDLRIPRNLFRGMSALRVMDLTGLHFSYLPPSIALLTNLRTLCLYDCILENIATVGKLKNLRALSLSGSTIQRLPQELGHLTQLQLLDLSKCSKLQVIPQNVISGLNKLEALHLMDSFNQWQDERSNNGGTNANVGELQHLPNLSTLDMHVMDASILPKDLSLDKLGRYKILIGDVWKWSGEYETSKTLKLKLNTSIHSDYRLKRLLEKVKDLYLDELRGVKNVLYELNESGFPYLKHLLIQNNAEIECITNSTRQRCDAFPKLETLVLENMISLDKLCHGRLTMKSFSNLRVIKVRSCNRLRSLFSISIIKSISQPLEMEISTCKLLEKIVDLSKQDNLDDDITVGKEEIHQLHSLILDDLPALVGLCLGRNKSFPINADQIMAYQNLDTGVVSLLSDKIAFPKLNNLELSSINSKKIWQDNITASSGFQNLTQLIVKKCKNLRYIMSIAVATSLEKLKRLEIHGCEIVENLFVTKGMTDTKTTPKSIDPIVIEEVVFPNLETLIIAHMDNLQTIWEHQFALKSFSKLKTVEINYCKKLEIAVPSYMITTLQFVEEMTVSHCGSLETIFDMLDVQIEQARGCGELASKLTALRLLRLPSLRHIWNTDPCSVLSFNNFHTVHVVQCQSLKYIFPSTVALSLVLLENLKVQFCGVEEIVGKEEKENIVPVNFVLPRVTSIILGSLFELKWFYPGVHTLECPMLKDLDVFRCDKMELFEVQSLNFPATGHQLGQIDESIQKPLFYVEKIIPALETFSLSGKDAKKVWQARCPANNMRVIRFQNFSEAQFPYWFHRQMPNLKSLVVKYSSFTELFPSMRELGAEERQTADILRPIGLYLLSLPKLESFCAEGSQVDPVLYKLQRLYVEECSGLKNLVPASVSFNCLTELVVSKCHGLINLISPSTAKSLVNLKWVTLERCTMLHEIVANDGDGAQYEIAFRQLVYLKLTSLPSLISFCSANINFDFPCLAQVIVRECPRMKIFSQGESKTPWLQNVKQEEDGETYWEGNLNSTIRKLFNK